MKPNHFLNNFILQKCSVFFFGNNEIDLFMDFPSFFLPFFMQIGTAYNQTDFQCRWELSCDNPCFNIKHVTWFISYASLTDLRCICCQGLSRNSINRWKNCRRRQVPKFWKELKNNSDTENIATAAQVHSNQNDLFGYKVQPGKINEITALFSAPFRRTAAHPALAMKIKAFCCTGGHWKWVTLYYSDLSSVSKGGIINRMAPLSAGARDEHPQPPTKGGWGLGVTQGLPFMGQPL